MFINRSSSRLLLLPILVGIGFPAFGHAPAFPQIGHPDSSGIENISAVLPTHVTHVPGVALVAQADIVHGESSRSSASITRGAINRRRVSGTYVVQGTGLGGLADNVYTQCTHLYLTNGEIKERWVCGVHPNHVVPAAIRRCLSSGGSAALWGGLGGAAMGLWTGGPFMVRNILVRTVTGVTGNVIQQCLQSTMS